MSVPLLVSAVLLLVSLAWALYDEFYGLRPWKAYQERFRKVYSAYLESIRPETDKQEADVRQSAAFQKMENELKAAEEAVGPQVAKIDEEVSCIDRRLAILTTVFQERRGEVTARIYDAEVATSDRRRQKILEDVEEIKKRVSTVDPFADTACAAAKDTFLYPELEAEYNGVKERKAALLADRARLLERASELRRQRDAYLADKLGGLSSVQLQGLLRKVKNSVVEIKQITVNETNLVDRCESCHLGIREPLELTPAAMGGEKAFVSHPYRELLRLHDPEKFGCSPCHGGNGRAVSSVEKAHGRYLHWLWPLYEHKYVEAGCQQCHARDMVVPHAETLNRGKELFREKGCIGCHRFEGFDDERERLTATQQELQQLATLRADYEREIQDSIRKGDAAATQDEANRLYAHAQNLRVTISNLEGKADELRVRARNLQREEKKVGPNLKEIRAKLRRDWIPVWLEDPHAFRPTTKMPRFGVAPDGSTKDEWREDVEALAAFLWQAALPDRIPAQPRGDAARGRELLMTRGCLACHSLGEGADQVGGRFAANFSRIGEKANYDYLVRWITNPRQRLRPYCPLEKRDLGPEDYARHGLPFQFDADHSTCPNDGEELVFQNLTVMPSLRLTDQEVRDIATFLMTQKRQEPSAYARADYMGDPQLAAKGKAIAKFYGCAGCHEISGLEEEGRIGTELTAEGSKPIERLDFALFTHEAKRGGWYDHTGFFERKLENPASFDQGRVREESEQLKMPKPNLAPEDVTALTTFLLGSVDPGYGFPASYLYRPEDRRRDVQEGWWIVTKYNCVGCHQIRVGQTTTLMGMPQYQTPEGKEQLPPPLISAGARLNPDWMMKFLANPALSTNDTHRNGVRTYLKIRMPTFTLSRGEIQTLVRFFQALAAQEQPYIPPKLEPLTERERRMARDLFTHPAAPCLKCHATGDAAHDRSATAPNFVFVPERLKPAWTKRWILDPASIAPGTAMPSGLFRRDADRWVFSAPNPPSLEGYAGDHADLLVRYMFELTPEEQRRLTGSRAATAGPETGLAMNVVKSH
jgi:cytochrome c551/c552